MQSQPLAFSIVQSMLLGHKGASAFFPVLLDEDVPFPTNLGYRDGIHGAMLCAIGIEQRSRLNQ